MFQQLLKLFGFFALVLVLLFWVNRAVTLLDWLLGDGQSVRTFLQLSILSLPAIMTNVLAIAAFATAVYVTNRLSTESELVVVQASGYSPYRLARATLVFAGVVTLMLGMLVHVLAPMASHELNLQRDDITRDVSARLLNEGTFVHPTDGVTFYVREITPAGELLDVYLSDSRSGSERNNFHASRALIVKEDQGPMLLMFDGMAQTLRVEDQRLAVTRFDSFAYSLSGFISLDDDQSRGRRAVPSLEILTDTARIARETGDSPERLFAEVHSRNGEALLALGATLIGFATLVVGGFSRFGLWRQVIFAVVLLVVVKTVDNSVASTVNGAPSLGFLFYVPPALAILIGYALLWKAAHPVFGLGKTRGQREARS